METRTLLASLLCIPLVLAGCLGPQDPAPDRTSPIPGAPTTSEDDQGDPPETDPQENETEEPPTDPEDNATGPHGTGNGADAGDDAPSNGTGAGSGSKACHEYNPPRPVPPEEQRVDDPDDVRCPGHFAILSQGTAPTLDVPMWQTGNWWSYETQVMDHPPTSMQETVNGTSRSWGVDVYDVYVQEHDAGGEETRYWETQRTTAALMQIHTDGAISHEILFPLAHNKSWIAMTSGHSLVTASVRHAPATDTTVEGWNITLHIERKSGHESIKKLEFDPTVGNVVVEELWSAHNGTATMRTLRSTLVDWHGAT